LTTLHFDRGFAKIKILNRACFPPMMEGSGRLNRRRMTLTTSKNKLNSKEKQDLRSALLNRRAVLMGDVNNMQDSALSKPGAAASGDLSTVPYHMADVGTDNFEHEFTLGLIENEEEELREIDAALERLDKGTFGCCERCKEPIPKSRLKIIPYTKLCIECKRGEEHEPPPVL
jgi:RNA polymerase-binding transcription factor DksA